MKTIKIKLLLLTKLLLYFGLFPVCLAGSLSQADAEEFIQSICDSTANHLSLVHPHEPTVANRLGISYAADTLKFFIGYRIPPELSLLLKTGQLKYEVKIESVGNEYTICHLTVNQISYHYSFYFKGRKLISSVSFHTREWSAVGSKYFHILFSHPSDFNQYCLRKLDEFVDSIAVQLGLNARQMKVLREKKIIYALCHDENEVENITGYKIRGMYDMAMDAIITSYRCHFHEIAHLLLNFKLGKPPLYPHPVLQEGLAVALGGRGGKAPHILLPIGKYLSRTGLVQIEDLFKTARFREHDPSISYPLSGLFTNYLLREEGLEMFLEYYTQYSANHFQDIPDIKWRGLSLDQAKWERFARETTDLNIRIDSTGLKGKEWIQYRVRETLLLSVDDSVNNSVSHVFARHLPNQYYSGEKYLIVAEPMEISVYNLYSDILIAKYAVSFLDTDKPVPVDNGHYLFWLKKDIFEEKFNGNTD